MQSTVLKALVSLLCGLIFGFGLIISDMVNPARVVGFLDLAGEFDPTLAFVMAGALMVFAPLYHLVIKKRDSAVLDTMTLPDTQNIDKSLIFGACLFGLGWGLSGICPGPGMVALVTGKEEVLVFVITMLLGMGVGRKIQNTH